MKFVIYHNEPTGKDFSQVEDPNLNKQFYKELTGQRDNNPEIEDNHPSVSALSEVADDQHLIVSGMVDKQSLLRFSEELAKVERTKGQKSQIILLDKDILEEDSKPRHESKNTKGKTIEESALECLKKLASASGREVIYPFSKNALNCKVGDRGEVVFSFQRTPHEHFRFADSHRKKVETARQIEIPHKTRLTETEEKEETANTEAKQTAAMGLMTEPQGTRITASSTSRAEGAGARNTAAVGADTTNTQQDTGRSRGIGRRFLSCFGI